MARVFVSHARSDGEVACGLHRWLVDDGHEAFLDQDLGDGIAVGEEWEQRLYERLRWADAVVCVVTSAYLRSTWCAAEVGIARAQGSRLMPVVCEPGVVHPLLASTQHVSLAADPGAARAALLDALRRIDAGGGQGWPDDRSPFPGLRPLDRDMHRVFFGRSEEVGSLASLLRSRAEPATGVLEVVVGPSGCGKSSLVRAGLLPLLAREPGWWTLPPLFPGGDPVAALAHGLADTGRRLGLSWTDDGVTARLAADGGLAELAGQLLRTAPGGRRRHLLVVVDQMEELLTQTPQPGRARFARLLRGALAGPVHAVATIRPESLSELLACPELAGLPIRPFALRPLRREALPAVIEGPARLAGIEVEAALVDRLVADTESGDALPLLAFTLAQLAEGVVRGGRLSVRRYEELGGVRGALARQADAALEAACAAGGRGREAVIGDLLRLVTVDEAGRPTRWRVPLAELPDAVSIELDSFVARRLLTTDDDGGSAVVGVAHEAFIATWRPLAAAAEAAASTLRMRRAVQHASAEWERSGRSRSRLWGGDQLAAALADLGARLQPEARERAASPAGAVRAVTERLLGRRRLVLTGAVELGGQGRDFLQASVRRDRRRRARATTVLSALLVAALAGAGISVEGQRTALQQRDVALSRQVATEASALRSGDPALAAQLSLAAYRLAPTTEARSSLLSTFGTPFSSRLTGHTGEVDVAAFSPGGRVLATGSGDGTVRLWDVADARQPRALATLTGHTREVSSAAFSPDGRLLATVDIDRMLRLWDVANPRRPAALAAVVAHADMIRSVAFSPDGRTIATASFDATARLWDVSDPRDPVALATITAHTASVFDVAFSPDGRTLATASVDHTARLWDIGDPRHPVPLGVLSGDGGSLFAARFSPDGRTLAIGCIDNTVRLWDVGDPRRPAPLSTLSGHTGIVYSVAFAPDGRTLASGSGDDSARLWDVADPRQPTPLGSLTGHSDSVLGVSFGPGGRTLATASRDDTVRLWDVPGPVLVAQSDQALPTLSPDGRTLVTGGGFTAHLWDVSDMGHPAALGVLAGHTDHVVSAAFSPDGRTLATGSLDFTARLWDVRDPRNPGPLAVLRGHTDNVLAVAYSPDGRTLATAGADHTIRLWDVSDPAHAAPLATLNGHSDSVNTLAFSPRAPVLASAGYDRTVRLWDVADPRHPGPLGVLTGPGNSVNSVAFDPGGRLLASASTDGTARLWDVSAPRRPKPVAVLTGHGNGVNSVAFGQGGRLLATSADDHTIRLWDVGRPGQPAELATLSGHADAVQKVAFGPDGHTLISGSVDGTARSWETDVARVAAAVCARAHPAITAAQWRRYLPDLDYRPPCG